MNKKRLIVTSVISIFLVCVLMLGSTYSIFTTSDVDESLNVYETGNLDITYTLSSSNVAFDSAVPISLEDSIWVVPYSINVQNSGTVPYMFDVMLEDVTSTESIDSKYIMVQVGKLEPKRLSECSIVDDYYVIKEDVILLKDSNVDVDVRIWIAEDVQNTEMEKSFYAKLVIDGIAVYDHNTEIDNSVLKANIPTNMSDYIVDLYEDGSALASVNIGGDSSNPSVSLNSKQGIMLDNNGEYRYYGSNPNNYVEFNGELWRIISVSNVKTDEDDTEGSTRVKIIRDESIGEYSWDSSESTINSGYGVNDWSQADLMTELNTIYYGRESGTCYNGQSNASTTCDFMSIGLDSNSKNLIDNALWYLGGSSVYDDLYADDYYNFERGTTTYDCSTDDGACPRATTWTGKIGLMYPSDYMYATDLEVCVATNYHETDSSQDYSNENCRDNDWLYNSAVRQWSISPYAGDASRVLGVYLSGYITLSGYVDGNYGVALAWAVRPAIYLRPDVMISGGDGTSSNPYQITVANDYLSSYIIDLYEDGSELTTVNIGGDSSNPSVSLNSKQGIMLDNNGEYRYYGSNPKNYVEFNGELWRIIGVSNVKSSEEDSIGSTRVKLIREETIGEYSWDTSDSAVNSGTGVNDWSQADLMSELNELYYNRSSGLCYKGRYNETVSCDFTTLGLGAEAKTFIDDALWYLGGTGLRDIYADDVYDLERGTEVYDCSTDDGACPRVTTWTGKIGLMYGSDYMYATDLSICTLVRYNESNEEADYRNAVCNGNDWLHQELYDVWTMFPYSLNPYRLFIVYASGNLAGMDAYQVADVLPSLYLKSNVLVTGGAGTKTNPYQIDFS